MKATTVKPAFRGPASTSGAQQRHLCYTQMSASPRAWVYEFDDRSGVEANMDATKSSPDGALSIQVRSDQAECPLRVRIRSLRLILLSCILVVFLAAVHAACYGNGVRLEMVSGEISDDDSKQLLDKYNSWSGGIVAIVTKPIEIFVPVIVTIALMSSMTNWILPVDTTQSSWKRFIPILLTGGCGMLLTNGLSSLNVQLVTGTTTRRLVLDDLRAEERVDDQPIAANGSLTTTWSKAFAEDTANNSVLNTILRTKLISSEDVQPQCKRNYNLALEDPAVALGVTSQPWQVNTLKNARTVASASATNNSDALPMDTDDAKLLVLAAISQLTEVLDFLWPDAEKNPLVFLVATDPPAFVSGDYEAGLTSALENYGLDNSSFVNASTELLRAALAINTTVLADDVVVSFENVKISDSMKFDALTLDIPTSLAQDSYTITTNGNMCGVDGCALAPAYSIASSSIHPLAHASAMCTTFGSTTDSEGTTSCVERSNTSMLIVSLGKRVVGKTWDGPAADDEGVMLRLDGLRLMFSLTVGVLKWEIDDLASVFDAECVANSCLGVQAPMDPDNPATSDVLLVGEAYLPTLSLDYFDFNRMSLHGKLVAWKTLVSLHFPQSLKVGDVQLLLPRRFDTVTEAGAAVLQNRNLSECYDFYDQFVREVEKNHLYAEQSLQMGYTAAFYFLFENGVLHSLDNATGSSSTGQSLLSLAGNLQKYNVQASIPLFNTILASIGCALVVLMVVMTVTTEWRRIRAVGANGNTEMLLEAMLNDDKYPSWLTDKTIQHFHTSAGVVMVPLDTVRVVSATLVVNDIHAAGRSVETGVDTLATV